jgi:hypothetical protein
MIVDFESMGETWRRQDSGSTRSPDEELQSVRNRAAELARTVRRRDWIETGVALVLLPLFAWVALRTPHTLSAIGAAIVAAACVLIPIRLKLARRATPDSALPVTQALRVQLSAVHAQQRLLGSVAWWYLGPLGAGVILFALGMPVSPLFKVSYIAAVVALYTWLLRLNLRAVRQVMQPLARQLESWIADFDDSSFDGEPDAQ